MKALALCLALVWNGLLPVDGVAQEQEPRFTHYLAATCLGNISGMILTGAVMNTFGIHNEGMLGVLPYVLLVGPTVGCNLGALVASRERGRVFRSNLLFTALPWVLLLNETTNTLGLYSIVFALPLITMINAYHIDHEAWRAVQSSPSVSQDAEWPVPVSPVEPVRFVAKVPVIQVNW